MLEALYYKEIARYSKHIRRYIDVFGRENVLIINFDDFRDDTLRIYGETLGFLGVNAELRPEMPVVNPNKQVRSAVFHNLLLNPPRVVRSISNAVMPVSLRQRVFAGMRRLNTRYEPRRPMDPELRRRLQAEFAPEVERLSELLGRDLTHWTRK